MSGYEDESAVPGPSVALAAKQVHDSAVRTAKKLENEHQTLLQLRSLVEQQLRVLQVRVFLEQFNEGANPPCASAHAQMIGFFLNLG